VSSFLTAQLGYTVQFESSFVTSLVQTGSSVVRNPLTLIV